MASLERARVVATELHVGLREPRADEVVREAVDAGLAMGGKVILTHAMYMSSDSGFCTTNDPYKK